MGVVLGTGKGQCADPGLLTSDTPLRVEHWKRVGETSLCAGCHSPDRRLEGAEQRVGRPEVGDVEVPASGEDDLRLRRGGPEPFENRGQTGGELCEGARCAGSGAGKVAFAGV